MTFKKTILTLIAAGVATAATAVPITGSISFGGRAAPVGTDGTTQTSLSDATGIDFGANGVANGSAVVINATGDFAAYAVSYASFGSFTDFQFSPVLSPSPVNPLWAVGGFSFSLSSVWVTAQNGSVLGLAGAGTISGNGFDSTAGSWSLSMDSPNNARFAFSSGTAAEIPDGGSSLALLGGALGLLGLVRRWLNK